MRKCAKGDAGFTLVETLAVVAILVILLGLSAVGAAYCRDLLKITGLDNAAREIYMAAENRAVLLRGGGQLESALSGAAALSDDGAAAALRYIRKTDDAVEELLPAGSVEPSFFDGEFYIVYDPAGGAVTDVFYTEEPGIPPIGDAFAVAGDRSARMKNAPMLGYYGGESAVREDYTPLSAPEVTVAIHNADRLTVDVTFTVPVSVLPLIGGDWPYTAEQTVRITCGNQTKTLLALNPVEASVRDPSGRRYSDTAVTYSWVLDSLDGPTQAEKGRHFYQLFDPDGTGPGSYGGDFTVTAEITLSAAGHRPAGAFGSDTNNSLFAEGSGGSSARIETLRHLQNLDADTSRAGGKTAAVQLADIRCYDNAVYPKYEFIPITNKDLASFDGGRNARNERNEILNLRVTAASASGKNGAGLFAGSSKEIRFTGVRLIDAEIFAASRPAGALIGAAQGGLRAEDVRVVNASVRSGFAPAGGIAGNAAGTSILKNCRICWEPETGRENLRSLLGNDRAGYQYKIVGSSAGGLIGNQEQTAPSINPQGEITVTDSFAAATIRGTGRAGGLIGSSEAASVTLANSYADCYLMGREAAGLVGHKGAAAIITNCYAAGWIDMAAAEKAAGLCLGGSAITAENTYSVMSYSGNISGKTIFRLDESQSTGSFTHTYYLGSESFEQSDGTEFPASSYDQMSSPDFAEALGAAFAFKGYKVHALSRSTHPYNLRENQNLTAYSFPGLVNLPHYGDWQTRFKEPSLVYYEEYKDGARRFSGGGARQLTDQPDGNAVTSDGYAIALLKPSLDGIDAFDITYTYLKSGIQTARRTVSYQTADLLSAVRTGMGGTQTVQEAYYLAPLPEDLVTGEDTTKDFYQYLRFEINQTLTGGGALSGEFFYNPHFAETVKPYASADNAPLVEWTDIPDGTEAPENIRQYITNTLCPKGGAVSVSIRTPRQLYNLSLYKDYYSNDRRALIFRQELDLDYRSYTGHGFGNLAQESGSTVQSPIGTLAAPFRGSYDGGCHTIEHVIFDAEDTDRVCAGLFGSTSGSLSNIVYKLDPEITFSRTLREKWVCFGTLAGANSGVITNCAAAGVSFSISACSSALYIGGLVGVNESTVTNCAVELASLTVDASGHQPVYAGGLAGRNDSGVLNSYVVGRLSARTEESAAPIFLSGFVCRNNGKISNCYSAMDLKADGAGSTVHGFCGYGVGNQSGACYLNKGNFIYRGGRFLADYAPDADGALSRTYEELTAPGSVSGMSFSPADQGFPYPTGVTDGGGRPIHYGLWPEPMDLGIMGVYYWEELYADGESTYHISLLAVDPGENAAAVKTVSKFSTLSTARDTGGEVRRYGYGFYNTENLPVILDEDGTLFYSFDGGAGERFTKEVCKRLERAKESDPNNPDREVDEALTALIKGFAFHSFHSFEQEKGGLYPGCTGVDAPNAVLTLEQGGRQNVKVTFYLNPHFADALAVKQPETGTWAAADGAEFAGSLPGGEKNPYGVRSIEQLQLIDWNTATRNTDTVIAPGSGEDASIQNFPYLSSSGKTETYYWTQSHDIKGAEGRVYSPIAELRGSTGGENGTLDGWFGGVYDGGGYLIENVDIQGGPASCAGLFGVVYNGVLKDITLCSSSGSSTVKGSLADERAAENSQWYAIGALAGIALTSDKDGGAIQNCAVSGYRIEAPARTGGALRSITGMGGLVGLSNMNLTGCAAVTDIRLAEGSTLFGNLYAGGLAGSCQGTVTNCYAGGTITADRGSLRDAGGADTAGIRIGGLVGGSCMGPLQACIGTFGFAGGTDGLTNSTLENCYSYVTLPDPVGHAAVKSLFAVGGADEPAGRSTRINCYYLSDETLANIEGGVQTILDANLKTDLGASGTGVTGLTYEQLSGMAAVEGTKSIYDLLTDFCPVSKDPPGKYSYPPAASPELSGLDYPFPTILVKAADEGSCHVHYGRWPGGANRT